MTKAYCGAIVNGNAVDIVCEDSVIKSIQPSTFEGYDEIIDVSGLKAFAGLVDIHTHGMGGIDTMDADIVGLARLQGKCGTTSFLPTTMTTSVESIQNVLDADDSGDGCANVLGYHLEGPYINETYIGAQNPKFLKRADLSDFKSYDKVKMVTLAPEMPNAIEYIKESKAVIALGHTDADYDIGIEAFDAGAKCLTHTFNAMKPIHHRNPGLIPAALDSGAYAQVICDGIHIHPSVIRLLYKAFGSDKMVLISDCMRATGIDDGDYEFGALTVRVKDGVARTLDGALAGSTAPLLKCVKTAIEFGIPEDEAFKMATETPAKLIGATSKGKLNAGYDADIIFTDDSYELKHVVILGKDISL